VAAAIGRVQLTQLPEWTAKRQANAAYLDANLKGVTVPPVAPGATHVYHQYTIRVAGDRDAFSAQLKDLGVGSAAYYPTPIHKLRPFLTEDGQVGDWKLPETDKATDEVLSLPIYPLLTQDQLDRIVDAVNTVAAKA
jgi:perosamine synthetase